MLGYGSGNFAFSLLGLVVAVNLQFFYTDYVGLSAGLVSWALLVARLFDTFVDPLMGNLSDRTHSTLGRRRPYILGAAVPLGLAFYCLFAPPAVPDPALHQGMLLLYLLVLYTLTYFICTTASARSSPMTTSSGRGSSRCAGVAIILATATSAACFWLADGTIGFFSLAGARWRQLRQLPDTAALHGGGPYRSGRDVHRWPSRRGVLCDLVIRHQSRQRGNRLRSLAGPRARRLRARGGAPRR